MRLNCTETVLPTQAILQGNAAADDLGADGTSLPWSTSPGVDVGEGRTGNHFRSAAPHIPRTIRVGFARARLDA